MAASPPRNTRKPAVKSARDGGPKEAAAFIAEQLVDLARLAHRRDLKTLGLLLDMGLVEAREKSPPPRQAASQGLIACYGHSGMHLLGADPESGRILCFWIPGARESARPD
jgi:hypothetical protein